METPLPGGLVALSALTLLSWPSPSILFLHSGLPVAFDVGGGPGTQQNGKCR